MNNVEQTLEVGFSVAVCLKPGAAPLRCYVGVDTADRVELLETATAVHWVKRRDEFCPGYDVFVLGCGGDMPWERLSFGSVAAITCARCRRAFEKERRG